MRPGVAPRRHVDESVRPEPAPRRPGPQPEPSEGSASEIGVLSDPRALTILTTEHWGLLTARSRVYNEAFSRGGMYLTFVSASLVALGFVSQGVSGPTLPWVVLAILALDLFVGLATLGRLVTATTEELRSLQAISRVRHAYLELVPTLELYELGPANDDLPSVLGAYGRSPTRVRPGILRAIAHGLTTMPGLVTALTSAVAGAMAAVLATVAGAAPLVALVVGVIGGALVMGVMFRQLVLQFAGQGALLPARFPRTPGRPT